MKLHLPITALIVLASCQANAAIVSPSDAVNDWTQGPTPLDRGPSNRPLITWTLENGGIETTNGSGSLISDFSLSGDSAFSLRIRTLTTEFADNDLWGVVFGFQDISNHYRLGWGAGGFRDIGGGGTGAAGLYFVKESGGVGSLLFDNSSLHWQNNVDYDVVVSRAGSNIAFSVTRVSDGLTMGSGSFTDSSFSAGRVGLWVESQATRFSNLNVIEVPEPSTFLVWSLFCLAVAGAASLAKLAHRVSQQRP